MHSHAERGNEHIQKAVKSISATTISLEKSELSICA